MRSWLAVVLLGCSLAAVAASTWTLEQLMQSLATVKVSEAAFTEKKELAILQEPLVMTGILRYRSPSYLKKQTLQPYPESYEADADWLTVETPEDRRQFHLRGYPLIQAFVDSVRATLAGDLATLERHYQVQLQGQASEWTLRLQPTDKQMAEFINAIVIRGQDNRVLSVETLETSGDRSLMTITPSADHHAQP